MVSVRILSDGRRVVRTSIDLDEDVYYTVKEMRLSVSSLVNSALLDYLGATSVDEDIARIRGISESVAKVCEINRLKTENSAKREALAMSAVKDRIDTARQAERDEADAQIADAEARATRRENLERSWEVYMKTRKLTARGIHRKLPEQDIDGDFTDYWPAVTSDLSKIAGMQFAQDEVVAYARGRVSVL